MPETGRSFGIPNVGIEVVGQEDHRPATELLLQQAGVQLGPLAARHRVLAGALGLHQG